MRKRPVVAILERHYSRVRGELQAIAEEVAAAGVTGPELKTRRAPEIEGRRSLLASIETCLRLVEPTWKPDHIQAVRKRREPEMEWGELLHIAYRVLQPTSEPLSSSEILHQLWLRGDLTREQAQSRNFRSKLTGLLSGEERRATVRSVGQRPKRWLVRQRGDPRTAKPQPESGASASQAATALAPRRARRAR